MLKNQVKQLQIRVEEQKYQRALETQKKKEKDEDETAKWKKLVELILKSMIIRVNNKPRKSNLNLILNLLIIIFIFAKISI